MLNKLKTWKDKLIDILNGSYKTSRRFMASFSVRIFTCLSLVCLTLLFTIILIDNQNILKINAEEPNPTLLSQYEQDANFLGYFYDKFYFKNADVYNNDGQRILGGFRQQSFTDNSSSGRIYNFSDGVVIYDGVFNGTQVSPIPKPDGVNTTGNDDSSNVVKIVASRNKAYFNGDCEFVFSNLSGLLYFDGTNFDTSNATNMNGMFSDCSALAELDLSNFDTSKVTTMKEMFKNYKGHELNISNFDTSSVTDMESMFEDCDCLNTLDLSNFDTSNVTTMKNMFIDCTCMLGLDCSSFDTTNVRNFDSMFNDCFSLLYLDLSSWVIDGSASVTGLFTFDGNIEVLKAPKNNIQNISLAYSLTSRDGTNISGSKLPITNGDSITIYKLKGGQANNVLLYYDNTYKYYSDGQVYNLSSGTLNNSINFDLYDSNGDGTPDTNCVWDLSADGNVKAYLFNDGTLILGGTGALIEDFEGRNMAAGANKPGARIVPWRRYKKLESLTKVVGALEGFKPTLDGSGKLSSLQSFFSFYSDSEDRDPSNLGTVFYNENVPESDIHLTTIDLTNFDITDVNNIDNLFSFNTAITEIKGIEDIDTTQVVSLNAVFSGCKNLMNLDLRNWNLRDAETFNYLFAGLGNKDTGNKVNINIDGWNVNSRVETANRMFRNSNIGTLSMNGVTNTDNIGSYYRMFENTTIDTLDLSSWDINGYDTNEMFGYDNGSNNYFADINTIILPNSIKTELVDTIPLPVKANCTWTGYESDGETKTGDEFTTLPYAGETTNLAMIKSVQDEVMYVDSNNLKFYHDKILDGNNSDNDITSYFNIYKVSLINNYVKLNTGLGDPLESDIENKKLEIVNDKNTIGAYFYMPKDTSDTGVYKNDATLILHGLKYDDKDTTLNIHSKVHVPAENGTAFLYLNSCDVYKLDGGTYRVINETSDPECYHDVSGVSTKNLYGDLIKLIDKAYISLIGYAAPSFSDAFNGASKVTTLDLGSRIDFSMFESYTANRMFQQMSNVTYINMGAFDGNLSQTAYMFYQCTNLETIDNATYMIDSNKAGLKDIKFMFSNCESLKNIDWSHWDVSNVTDAYYAFSRMYSMDTFDFSNWDCNISSANAMFAYVKCDNPINFGNMNFDGVNDITSFYQDATLPYYDYTIFKNSTLKNVTFSGYGNKNTIDFEGVDFSNVNSTYGDNDVHFGTMDNASEIILPSVNYGREGALNTYPQYMTLGNQTKKIWQGYSKNSSTGELEVIDNYYVYDGYVPVAGSDYTGTLYAIKQVNAEEMTEIDGKYYYKNQWVQGTTKHNILTYYDVDGYVRPCVWDISKAEDNSIMCYIYDDGTMLFDGAGLIKGAGDGYILDGSNIPWRMTYKDKDGNDFIPIDNVTKIIGSNAGFKPEGSLAYYFSPVTIQNTVLKNHIKTVDVTNFDTSKVNCFDFTFSGINNVDGIEFINIDKLNTSMAQSMKSMFEGVICASLDLHATIDDTDPLNVKKYWDVSKVHDFGNMFYAARIDTVNLDNWNLDSTYTNPNGINFAGQFGFVYAAHIKNLSLNNWTNTSKVNPAKFLAYVWELNSVDLSSFNFEINQENISFLYHRNSVNEIILPNTLSADKINVLSDWDVVQNYGYYGCNKDGEVVTTMPYKYLIGKVDSNGDGDFLDKTDIYMFKLISDTLYTDSDTNISYYRGGTSKSSGADAVTLVKEFDITNTSGPNNTPAGAVKAYLYSDGLLIFDGIGDIKMSLDYNDLDPSNTEPEQLEFLTDTYRNQIKNIVGSIRGFKPNGTLRYLCYNMDNLETFDGTKFDLTNVTNLMCMFENDDADGDSKLTSVIFGNTNTNSIISLNSMFDRCKSLTNVNLGNNTFTNVNNTAYMFNDCTSIENIDLSSLNCELTGCKYMFGGTSSLASVILGDDTNGYNITLNTDDISCMFTNTGLTSVDFTKFKESKKSIKKIEGAAGFNSNTTLINLHGLDLSLATLANQSGSSDADKEKRRLFYSASWDYNDCKDTDVIETIILPSNVPALADALYLPHVDGYVWQGYESDGTTKAGGTFTTLPKAGEVTNLNMIKLVRSALYVDDTDSSNIIEYYSNGTNKADITLDQYDSDNDGIDDTDCVWNLSTDGKVKAYLYTDGTLILDGEGTINNVTNNGSDNNDICHIIYPWRQYKKLVDITKIVGSINGFTPHGSIESLFDFTYDGTYYTSGGNEQIIKPDIYGELNINKVDVSNFNMQNVTNARCMFRCMRSNTLNNLYIEGLNFSSCTDLSGMFIGYKNPAGGTQFNLHIKDWILNPNDDVDISSMFGGAGISSLDMSGWQNTSSISNISNLFNYGYFIGSLDLSDFSFTNTALTNSVNTANAFNSVIGYGEIILPNDIDSNVNIDLKFNDDEAWYGYDLSGKRIDYTKYTKLVKSEGDTNNKLYKINKQKEIIYIDDSDLSNVIEYNRGGTNIPGLTLDKYDSNKDGTDEKECIWNLSTDGKLKAYLYTDGTLVLDGEGTIKDFTKGGHDNQILPWREYKKLESLTRVVGSINGFAPAGSMADFFSLGYDADGYYSSNISATNQKLTSIDFTNIDTKNVDSFKKLFYYAEKLDTLTNIENINTSNVTNMMSAFTYVQKINNLNLSNWDVSNVTIFNYMFNYYGYHANNYTTFNLSNWVLNNDTDKDVTMIGMFDNAYINSIDMSGWTNTDNISKTKEMFKQGNFKIVNPLDLSSIDFINTNLTNSANTSDMFKNSTIRDIILPNSMLDGVDISLPSFSDKAWMGYNNDTSVGTNSYTKLMAKTNTSDGLINRLKVSDPTLFTIDNISYSSNDKVAEWDISKKNNGSIKAYLFKDPTDSNDLTLVFDQTSDKFGSGDDDYNIVKTYSNDSYDNSLHTPWYSYLSNSNNSDKHITKVGFNSDINFEQLNYYFSYMPDLTELDLSHFVCTTEYDANALNSIFDSLNMHIKLNYRFKDPNNKRDFNYTIYNSNSSDFVTNEDNNVTLDLSGLTFDNLLQDDYKANDFSYHLYFNKIIVPEKMNNYTKNIAALCVNQAINMYEAYNDNGTPLDESDDEFLGYTIYMTDNNHAFDNFSKSVSYLKIRKDLAPYAAFIAYKDNDIDYHGFFTSIEKHPHTSGVSESFINYVGLLEQFNDNSITTPSNYEFLYDGTGTDPFNTLEDVIDKDVFYSYLVNAYSYNYDFISNMFLYVKEKQDANNISDTDFNTLKLYMNEYIHDLFKVTLDNIGTLNYLDELKITVTNGLANVLNNFYKLYEVIGISPNEETNPVSKKLDVRVNYLFDKSWDEVSDLIKDMFENDASGFNSSKDFYAPGSGADYLAYVSNVAGSILPSVFKETDSYYVIKISDTYNSGIILYYYDKLEECMIDIYVLGDNNWIFQDITGKMNLLKSGDSSTLDLANDILSDSDVERLFVKNQIELSSSQDNIDGVVFALADNGIDYDYTNAYIAIPKNPKIYKKQMDNEFTISNTKVGNFVYEIRPLVIDLMKFILDHSGFSNYDPDVKPFNYKRVNVTVNALDISTANDRVYAGDISSKVFDGVNAITCDSEVHLYYKNNEWQDGDDPIELAQGVDYTITGYSDNDKQGTATVHLQGISPNVTGTRDITFNIVNAIKKLDINDLTISDSEKAGAIINKDGTDEDDDAISFNSANLNELHPYILDSDGITPIYLSYTKAYVSDSDGYPNYIARAKDTSDPLAISNITFKGLKLVDQSGAYELYEDNTFNKLVSVNNGNDTFTLNDSCKLIDLSSPKIDKIIITNNKNTKLKENDTVNVSITFSEELNLHGLSDDTFANTYKDDIYLTYKIGLNSFSDYKLNLISIESPRAFSVTNRKTILNFSGKLPSDLGELIDVPFTLYELFMGSITDAELSDLSGNGHDISNFSTKINTPELTGYLVNTKVDEPDPIKPEPEKPITTQTITVQVVKNNKYIEGYSDGTFKPNDNITRGEFSKMLAYISNNYSDSNKLDYSRYINSFKDVFASDWYSSYVGFNNKKQVMVGYSDGTFRPNKELTRAEAAKALTNMFSINTNNNVNIASTFNNELNGKWYEYSMKKLINAGLLKGYPDGLLRPNDPITRAEMVALINRITNRDINNNAINNNSNLRNIPYDVDSNKWYYKDIISALNDY